MNENNNLRGLHIVIINPTDGKVLEARAFDTYKSSSALNDFIEKGNISMGHIIVAACKDDCVSKLSNRVDAWFKKMGSV